MTDEHVFTWEQVNYNNAEGGWMEFSPGNGDYRAQCRCGWTASGTISFNIDRARAVWERYHYNELTYQKIRAQIHGRTFQEDYDRIKEHYRTIRADQEQYDTNPFGQ